MTSLKVAEVAVTNGDEGLERAGLQHVPSHMLQSQCAGCLDSDSMGGGGGFLVIITYSSILFWGAPYDKYSIIRRQVQEGESSASAMRRPSGPRTALHS